MALDPSILALISALMGGVVLETVKGMFTRKSESNKAAFDLRAELHNEVKYLREQLNEAEKEKERLRENYYKLRDDFSAIKNDLDQALQKLKDQTEEAQSIIHEIGEA